jgi:tRNA1(Val) A37 N6-methylase TrmN6
MPLISQVERSAMHRIVGWMKETIKEEKLPFQVDADIELTSFGKKRNFPDILIFTKYPNEVACLIEFKPPVPYDPYDPELVDHTYDEANRAPGNFNGTCRYFGTWNLNKFVLWDKKEYKAESFLDMIFKPYEVADAREINDIIRSSVEESVKKFLRQFLKELHEIYFEIKPIPALHIDELFIYRLRTAIDTFFIPISEEIYKEAKRNIKLKRELRKWFAEQAWFFQDKLDDYDRTARQYTYLIVDKVLFYNALRIHKKKLDEIKLDRNLTADRFKKELQKYFDKALEIDYEPIFAENFLETLPLPDSIIPQIVSFIDSLNHKYNFSSIGYEIIGRVFERLIPEKERHQLGQYFTRSDVVDIINAFCIKTADDIILDPGCGAATFPIRAYSLIKQKNRSKSHKELLGQLYGIDISKFAAHLSMINLTIKDLSEKENYPYVVNSDFFDIFPEQLIKRKYKIRTPSGELAEIRIPHVDVVVGNPPYTRQEEMESAFEEKYKEKLDTVIKKDFHFSIGKRSGIYSYFFIHGSRFLKDGGRFGFVTSNSWLDVDYGKYLQEFFLNNHKIVAVIESKVERWFEDADINTCITVLERCKDREERNNNLIRFVQLKVPLKKLIPLSENENERCQHINKIKERILDKNEYFEDDEIRVYPKNQEELFFEGFDEDEKIYVGSKWGKYIRAPEIFFVIFDKGKDKLIPIKKIADVRRGITTGANEFFYITKDEIKKLGIEKEFWSRKIKNEWVPNFVIKSPREANTIDINPDYLKYMLLNIHQGKIDLRKKNVYKYILFGERKGFEKRPTCRARGEKWFDVGAKEPYPILWVKDAFSTHIVYKNLYGAFADCRFYEIKPFDRSDINIIVGMLNSSLGILFAELAGRATLGLGARDIMTYEASRINIINPKIIPSSKIAKIEKVINKISKREISDIFKEIGASNPDEVTFKKVEKDRFELDNVIFDILNLSRSQRLEVYKAVVDLVKSRLEKAKSVKKKSKKSKLDLEVFAENILEDTRYKELRKFPNEYLGDVEVKEKELPEGNSAEIGNDLFNGLHVKVDGEIVKCSSMEEAKYIKYAILNGNKIVKIPERKEDIARIVKKYDDLVTEIQTKAEKILKEEIKDKKLKEKIEREIDRKIFRRG